MKLQTSILLLSAATATAAVAQTPVRVAAGNDASARQAVKTSAKDAVTVLEQKKVADGVVMRTVRDSQGRIYRDMLRNGVRTPGPQTRTIHRAASADASFYEGFENGPELYQDPDYIPEGWTEINTEGNLWHDDMPYYMSSNNWRVTDTGDGYWTAITSDGVKECFIHFGYKIEYDYVDGQPTKVIPIAPQDEWLITPQFRVKQNQKLYFDLEIDLGSLYYYDWGTSSYDYSRLENDLEVLVSTNDGADWTSIWKASANMVDGKYTDSELAQLIASLKYYSVSIPIDQYFGKDVKIAFRYINTSTPEHTGGNSMAIDAVMVDTPASSAEYDVPDNSFFQGITNDGYTDPRHILFLPPYTDIHWVAKSNTANESYTWAFYNPADGEMTDVYNTREVDHAGAYTADELVPYPVLTAANSFNSAVYAFGEYEDPQGGIRYTGEIPALDGLSVNVGNYDFISKGIITPIFETGSYVFGISNEGSWGSMGEEVGFGNLFQKPLAPFTVNEVNVVLGEYDADPGAVFTLEFYGIDDYGYTTSSTPIYSTTCTGADVTGEAPFFNMCFKLKDTEGRPTEYVLNERTLMLVTGFYDNEHVRSFGASTQRTKNDEAHNYAWVKLYDKNDGWTGFRAASDVLQDYANALIFGLKGSYNFFHLANNEFTISGKADNARDMEIEAGNAPAKWNVMTSDGEKSLAQPVVDEWLTISAFENDGRRYLRFSGEPFQGIRTKYVTISTIGAAPITIAVTQDENFVGVESVTVDQNAPVEYYNLQGIRVQNPTGGLYIKRQGSKTSKVLIRK